MVNIVSDCTYYYNYFFFRVLGLLIYPKITEAKIMIKILLSFTPPNTHTHTHTNNFVGKKWFFTMEETM